MSRKFKNSELIVRGGIGLNPKTKKVLRRLSMKLYRAFKYVNRKCE